jgi:hypothetical protein
MHLAIGALLTNLIMATQLTSPGAPMLPRARPPLVAGQPYIASFKVSGLLTPEVTGYLYRDSSGRTRVDLKISDHEVRYIDDVSTYTLFIVDVRKGTYQRDTYGPSSLGWSFSNVSAASTEEHQNILGVDCVRVIFKPSHKAVGSDLGDSWISRSLGIVMKDSNPAQHWKWEVTSIEFREPDAEMFKMPADFREEEQ